MIENEPQESSNYIKLVDIYTKLEKFEELDKVYQLEVENVVEDDKELALLNKAKMQKKT